MTPNKSMNFLKRVFRKVLDLKDIKRFLEKVIMGCILRPLFRKNAKRILGVLYKIDASSPTDKTTPGIIEQHGFYLLKKHFYNPIPDTLDLRSRPQLWEKVNTMPGVDQNLAEQVRYLKEIFPRYREAYETLPHEPIPSRKFFLDNDMFSDVDAQVLVCMLLHFQPQRIIEIGGGYSTVLMVETLAGREVNLTCIEPYQSDLLHKISSKINLLKQKVQDISLDAFKDLTKDDILFIDSSHTVTIGGDVPYLFLEVLPRLKPGVIIHIHDVYFPYEYPKRWIFNLRRYWTEQHLLHAFLLFNRKFDIIFSKSMMNEYYPEELRKNFPGMKWYTGGSFWMKRKDDDIND